MDTGGDGVTGIKTLSNKAWNMMSRYVRLRGDFSGRWCCITCGKPYTEIRDVHAGHFKHAPRTNQVSYDLRNVWPQCPSCNSFGRGKLDVYAERLVEVYGPDVLAELTQLKKIPLKGKDKRQFFLDKIAELESLLEGMG
jgi:hypothetical protein